MALLDRLISVLVATVLVVGVGSRWPTVPQVRLRFRPCRHRPAARPRVVAAVLLAYPVWFFVAGPAHLSGSVWTTNVPG